MNEKGWKLGLLVARSVCESLGGKPWELEGISKATYYRRYGSTKNGKISARKFAIISGIDRKDTVCKYLISWNMASVDGMVPHSSELFPGQEVKFTKIHTQDLWEKYLSNFDEWYLREAKDFILDERHTPELWDYYFRGKQEPCVYFIGYKGRPDFPIKIGKSVEISARLSGLQTGSGLELELLFTIPGYTEIEKELHRHFSQKCSINEWFNLNSEDLEWVKENYG